jgi:acyl-CoA reductase-like NAD-dependent aldehyde dehydrogenase
MPSTPGTSASSALHLPVLRFGQEYRSLAVRPLRDPRSGELLAEIGQVNAGIVRRDLRKVAAGRRALEAIPALELVKRLQRAGELFLEADLPLVDGHVQSAAEYRVRLGASSGMPLTLARANQEKVAGVLGQLPDVLRGLTRGLDLSLLDRRLGEEHGTPLWYVPTASSLGVILPSNSPGVNALWLPALALKVPVLLKPGAGDPWTPFRLARALVEAGIPSEAIGLYPTDHEGAAAILEGCERSILFGDRRVTSAYAGNPAVEIHGPGYSKVLLGPDEVDRWEEHLDCLVTSIAGNGGRSCVNASCIVVPAHGDAIAAALAERLNAIEPRAFDDPEAALAAFADAGMAERIDQMLENALAQPGARDVTAAGRGPRRVTLQGSTFLRPTLVRCTSLDHPLASAEYMFPFASVVEVPAAQALEWMGESLVVTAITRDAALCDALLASPHIGRLNLGPVPTGHVCWDQPHEGNLFEFLHARRAVHRRDGW